MAFCRVVFPLLVLSVISCYASSKVPVFLWGDLSKNSFKSNPLETFNSSEFEGILKEEMIDNTLTIVFIEETLSVEDFSLKNDDGKTSFPYLHDNLLHHGSIYLPSVYNASQTLSQIADPRDSVAIELTENGLSQEIPPKSSGNVRFVFINLKDAREGESRASLLRRHDDFMRDTLDSIMSENKKIVAIYTAEYPSWTIPVTHSRVRRAARANARVYGMDGLRLYAENIRLTTGNNSTPLSGVPTFSSEFNGTTMNTTMTFETTSIKLNFNLKGGYWFFDTVTLTMQSVLEELYPNEEVFAILGFSYRCQQHISFSSVNETNSYTLSFEDLKIQPFFETTNATQQFGDSFNCIGFFSAPIWAGLFVTFILLLITFYGIIMMLDIRTMDRFDDPKGKTITINSE